MKNNKYLILTGMGFELGGIIIASVYLGGLLDEKFGSQGLAMVGISMCGLIAWIFHVTILYKKIEKEEEGK